jgi:hypothetical protein
VVISQAPTAEQLEGEGAGETAPEAAETPAAEGAEAPAA